MFLQKFRDSGKHELLLQSDDVEKVLNNDENLSDDLFALSSLNVLSLKNSPKIRDLPAEIDRLTGLLSLTISKTKLDRIPESIGNLRELKSLDLSCNELVTLPSTLGLCARLQNLNLSHNRIQDIPHMDASLDEMRRLDVSHNALAHLPLSEFRAFELHELVATSNVLTSLPAEMGRLTNVRHVDCSSNQITTLPVEMVACSKLKFFCADSNPFRDRRLAKLVASHGTTKPKSVLDYLGSQGGKKGSGKKGNKGSGSRPGVDSVAVPAPPPRALISVFPADLEKGVAYSGSVSGVRPHIVCTVLKGLDISDPEVFRKFISLQTDLHDGICEKRRIATIATHDLEAICFPLSYEARPLDQIQIQPLGYPATIGAIELVRNLGAATRKVDHDLPYLGLKKYLSLLAGAELYPCLVDDEDIVISFPPLTNCDKTKVSEATKSIFVEVTSSKSLGSCRMVMDLLISKIIDGEFVTAQRDSEEGEKSTCICIEQCRIVTEEGKTRTIYPSREDLHIENVKVERQNKKQSGQ